MLGLFLARPFVSYVTWTHRVNPIDIVCAHLLGHFNILHIYSGHYDKCIVYMMFVVVIEFPLTFIKCRGDSKLTAPNSQHTQDGCLPAIESSQF